MVAPVIAAGAVIGVGTAALSAMATAIAGLYGMTVAVNEFLDKHIEEIRRLGQSNDFANRSRYRGGEIRFRDRLCHARGDHCHRSTAARQYLRRHRNRGDGRNAH